jgi:hypothetical protein
MRSRRMWDARSRRARTGAIDWGLVAGRVGLLAALLVGWAWFATRAFGSDQRSL